MSLQDVISSRGIEEVVHFTTKFGLLGSFHTRAVLPRARLERKAELAYILKHNASYRKDVAWLDYVNLSITHINRHYYSVCSGKWHAGERLWWCIMSFDPRILSDNGVVFTTTNNIYPSVIRAAGAEGLENMFKPVIEGRYYVPISRSPALAPNVPTDEQAEVLYPGSLSTNYLKRVYFKNDEDADEAAAYACATNHAPVEIRVAPERFLGRGDV